MRVSLREEVQFRYVRAPLSNDVGTVLIYSMPCLHLLFCSPRAIQMVDISRKGRIAQAELINSL